MKKLGDRGQLKISFGMLFSIILIIVFIAFAIYAIIFFLDLQKNAKIGKFFDEFQSDVDSLWRGTYGNQEVEYYLPEELTHVCIKIPDVAGEDNVYFLPEINGVDLKSKNISHIDQVKTTSTQNKNINPIQGFNEPQKTLCVKNIDGKIRMILKKAYGENSITISRA